MNDIYDKARLRKAAKLLRAELETSDEVELIRWRRPLRCEKTETQGWGVTLGSLGRGKPSLELWLDRYPRKNHRCFYFGFYSTQQRAMRYLVRHAPDYLQPVRELTDKHQERVQRSAWLLRSPLNRQNFNRPISEHYWRKYFWFGVYDLTPFLRGRGERLVVRHAAAFFNDVLRSLTPAAKHSQVSCVYPQVENREVVRKHVDRERSGYLAETRKEHDRYRCQVCGMRFEDVYGVLGRWFAEAHHVVPLSRLTGKVYTTLKDLITVCSNCHRMLHRMDGKRKDVGRLRRMLRGRRTRRRENA